MIHRNRELVLTGVGGLFCLSALLLSCGCGGGVLEIGSDWAADSITVDGRADDWKSAPLNYLEEKDASFGLRNDGGNLYILFSFTDETWLRMISLGGVTLWLDATGGKKKDFGIQYAGGPPLEDMPGPGMPGREGVSGMPPRSEGQGTSETQDEKAHKITVIDKKADKTVVVAADGTNGPAASFAETLGVYTYEFSIPLEAGDEKAYALKTQPGETIGIGLEWGGGDMGGSRPTRPEMGPGASPGGPGGGGRPPGGPGGGGAGAGPGREPPEKQEIWVKCQLAEHEGQE